MIRCKIEKLNKNKHGREGFDCGLAVLNTYLQTRANQEQKKRLNVTYVATPSEENKKKSGIIGYYTLSNSSMTLSAVNPEIAKGIPPTYDIPTIKIGRLAVDKNYHHQGLGSLLLQDACLRIIELTALSGIKGVEVGAKTAAISQFYQKFGFVPLRDTPHLLFLPLETLLSAGPLR